MVPNCVSIVIANFNRVQFLKGCLESVRAQTYPPIEIIVVDNGSSDGSAEFVRREYPEVRLLSNAQNELYCKAQNQGIAHANGEYVLSLNNDVVLERDCVFSMVSAFEGDERIGLVSGRILSIDGKRLDSAGLMLGRTRKPVERGKGKEYRGQFSQPEYIFGAGGAAAMYRRAMLEDVKLESGYFDESFGLFYEDLDLSWRAHRNGWRAYYVPGAVAYHIRGGTASEGGKFLGYDFCALSLENKRRLVINRFKTILRNDSFVNYILNLPFILSYDLKVFLYSLFFEPRLLPVALTNNAISGIFKKVMRYYEQLNPKYETKREIAKLQETITKQN